MTHDEVQGLIGRWSPGIGDPTIMGWITVGLYLVCSWQCREVSVKGAGSLSAMERLMWHALFIGLLLLGINKQLDLQTAFTELGRVLALQQGWYENRRSVQIYFIYSVLAVAFTLLISALYLAKKSPWPTTISLIGSICLVSFVVIRATSFHHVDLLIVSSFMGISMNWILEIGGIGIVALGAFLRKRLILSLPRLAQGEALRQ